MDRSIKILVVDDNSLDVEKIIRCFSRLKIGNDIVHAEDGLEALGILRGNKSRKKLVPPYVVLLDLNMPRMNGLEFLEALRADDTLSHVSVFVLTTSDHQVDVEAVYKFNVSGYIVKPVKMEQTLDAFRNLNMYWNLTELPLGESDG